MTTSFGSRKRASKMIGTVAKNRFNEAAQRQRATERTSIRIDPTTKLEATDIKCDWRVERRTKQI